MMRTRSCDRFRLLVVGLLACGVAASGMVGTAHGGPPVDFNRDVRSILAENCFPCHGPDKGKRKANLRLDTEDGARADRNGRPAVVPGDLARSALYRRITAADEEERMPPAKSGKTLTARQVEMLRRWIEQGAKWQKHWSLISPSRPPLPAVRDARWPRNAIDSFILARLDAEGLVPPPEADRTTLIRRLTLDLTGLPPTPAEVDAFLADPSPDAYEKVVERLLASPRYGERMASRWLDGARYADTNGYQSDGERFMWRWRDWVIDAFNGNMPFDRFTVEQIAGDLLPNPTLPQRIATGFNRNHRGNGEGGIIPEEYAVEYVVDRVETTATVWLGLTLGCTRCHDHKFDPFTQKEFYRLFAFFNNVPERGKAIKFGNSPPVIKAPTQHQQHQLHDLERQLADAEGRWAGMTSEVATAQAAWEKTLHPSTPLHWAPEEGLIAHYPLYGASTGRFLDGEPAFAPGRVGQAARFDGRRYLDAGDVGNFGFYDKFSCAAWVHADDDHGGTILSRMTDQPQADGYRVGLRDGRVEVHLVKRFLDDALRVETDERLLPRQWHHVLMVYDGSRVAAGIKVYLDGRPAKLRVLLDDLNQSFESKEPLRIGAGGGPGARFRGLIDDVRVYHGALSADDAELLATVDAVDAIAALPLVKRTSAQAHKLRAYFLERAAPDRLRQAHQDVVRLRRQRAELVESFPTTMVMEELPRSRDTFVLVRGQYDKHGEPVTAGVPASLPPLPPGVPANRLGFARWLVDPANPLTARVLVNRSWQQYFATGLVKTVEDFGSQGEWPSHPELLDFLATEFVRTGWDVKALQRLIVTSATYRQSSRLTPALLQRDPDNRLLARGPRFRLPAEMIRDQALAASGLLVERVGGPSAKPYQPAALWRELADVNYVPDHGPSLYRRSLYTFWKRTVAPPEMIAFDAAGRETCIVRETRTNTPLQALTLMNDVTFVEAARVLAQRVMTDGGTTPEERLTLAFRLATGRRPRAAELRVLVEDFRQQRAQYRQDPKAATKLVSAGEHPRNDELDVGEFAAYTAVTSLILNLDEVVTRE
jgi:hypothetical protein